VNNDRYSLSQEKTTAPDYRQVKRPTTIQPNKSILKIKYILLSFLRYKDKKRGWNCTIPPSFNSKL